MKLYYAQFACKYTRRALGRTEAEARALIRRSIVDDRRSCIGGWGGDVEWTQDDEDSISVQPMSPGEVFHDWSDEPETFGPDAPAYDEDAAAIDAKTGWWAVRGA